MFSNATIIRRGSRGGALGLRPPKRTLVANLIIASLLSMLFLFVPSGSFADEKTDTAQAVESGTKKSDQASDQAATKNEVKKDQTLEPIVVTATRTEKSLEDVPAAVSVVTSKDIESRNIQRVDEAINALPGVFNETRAPLDQLGDIMIRGIQGQQRNLVLLDGEPLNQPFAGLVNWNSLNPLDIERIEVVRGPFSSLWGGDAMGGVINIITKTPQEREVTIQSGYGSFNTWNEYGSYGDKLYDRLSVFASFGYRQTGGYPNIPVTLSGQTPPTQGGPYAVIGNSGNLNYWTQSGSIKFVYDLTSDSKATFSYRNNQYGFGYGPPQTYVGTFSGSANVGGVPVSFNPSTFVENNDKGAYMENIFRGEYQTKLFGDGLLKIAAGYIDTPTNYYDQPGYTATYLGGAGQIVSTSSDRTDVDVQFNYPLLEKCLLTVGGAYRHDSADQPTTNLSNWTDPGSKTTFYSDFQGKDNIYSAYGQAEIALRSNLTLYAGLREDYWTTYDGFGNVVGGSGYSQSYGSKSDSSVSPKGSLVYKPWDGTTLRSSVGTSFRPPTVYELYTSWESFGYISLANPNLKPETSFSWDMGAEQKLGSNTVCKLNYFNNTMRDYIYWEFISYNPSTGSYTFQNVNAAKAETDGVELEIENKPLDWLRLFTNATFTHSKMLSNPYDPKSVGYQLPYVPEWLFNVGAELTYRKFSFMMIGRFADKQYADAYNRDTAPEVYGALDRYFVADCKLRYKLTDRVTMDFAVNNISDEKYFTYYQAPGREFFGGFTAKFK